MMSWFTEPVNGITTTIIAAILAGGGYLLRRIFTNQAEINLLKQRLDSDSDHRKERDNRFETMLQEIRQDIRDLRHK